MIKVGLTEMHGICKEYSKVPPSGIEYSEVGTRPGLSPYIFKSAAKGVYFHVNDSQHDIIEAPLFPVMTDRPWIFTPSHFSAAGAFDFFGLPTPRSVKMLFVKHFIKQSNLKRILFKSQFGLQSLKQYGGIDDPEILAKTDVVYPVVQKVSDSKIKFQNEHINLIYVGDFYWKGGMPVVDAFIELKKVYKDISLTLCCDPDLNIPQADLKQIYQKKIENDPSISIGLRSREEMMEKLYPNADIYVTPTFEEAWGFSIEEAMAFGLPIISSKISAIPEMVQEGENGFLIDLKAHPVMRKERGFRNYSINQDFLAFVKDNLLSRLETMISDFNVRKAMGMKSLMVARSKFSPETRNEKVGKIYQMIYEGKL